MKKSIGIIAAVVLTTSVYSQEYDPDNPHKSSSSAAVQSDSSSASSSSSSSTVHESSPGRSEFDAQSSLRGNADYNDGAAKQGLTLSDEEAAQTLRNTDDPDLANRNHEEGLTDPDRASELNNEDTQPDVVYEEWILITPEDVGSPAEVETGTSDSKDIDIPADPEMPQDRDNDYSAQFDRETGILNDERIHSDSDYSEKAVGAPANTQSGTLRSSDFDDCEVNKGDQTSVDRDERLNLEREEGVGAPAQSQSESTSNSDEGARSSNSSADNSSSRDLNSHEPSSQSTTPPDL